MNNKNNITYSKNLFGNIYTYFKNGRNVGHIESPLEERKHVINPCSIDYLFVSENFRNQGIGTELVDHLSIALQSKGCKTIEVTSVPNAYEFYEKNGFVPIDSWFQRKWNGLEDYSTHFKKMK
jgi:GNAT superfamily N-acetyltransferase